MSLILDALRRADSERERGSVPGLHTQPVPPLSMEASPRSRGGHWPWLAAGVAGVLLIAIAWFFLDHDAPTGATVSAQPQPRAASPAVAAAAPIAAAPPGIAAPAPTGRPGEAPQVAEPAPWPAAERKATQASVAAAPPSVQAGTTADPRPAPPAETPIYAREQLPQNVRAELPQLSVGGSIYSSDAASRSVIINGRLYRENDRLTADLSLEQIKLKAAVLKYKGYRFEIEF